MRGVTNAAPASGLKVIAEVAGSVPGNQSTERVLPSPAKVAFVSAWGASDASSETMVALPNGLKAGGGKLTSYSATLTADGLTLELTNTINGVMNYRYLVLG